MIVLGVLMLLIAALAILAALLRGGQATRIDAEWFTIKTDVAGVFVAGALTVVLAVVGLWLLTRGLRRSRRRRSEMHALRDRAKRADEAMAREREPGHSSPGTAGPDGGDSTDEHFDSTPRDP